MAMGTLWRRAAFGAGISKKAPLDDLYNMTSGANSMSILAAGGAQQQRGIRRLKYAGAGALGLGVMGRASGRSSGSRGAPPPHSMGGTTGMM